MSFEQTLSHLEARAVYNRIGSWQDTQAFYEDRATRVLFEHGDFESARSVFELGVGTGRLAEHILSHHLGAQATYRAVDVTPRMVELAKLRNARFGDRFDVTLTDGDIRFDVPDGSVDRFFSSYVLDLLSLEDIDRAFAEAHRMLAPGGKLCCTSATFGQTRPQRAMMGVLERLYGLSPKLLGGCRPVALAERLSQDKWQLRHHEIVSAFGVCSEIVVAEARR